MPYNWKTKTLGSLHGNWTWNLSACVLSLPLMLVESQVSNHGTGPWGHTFSVARGAYPTWLPTTSGYAGKILWGYWLTVHVVQCMLLIHRIADPRPRASARCVNDASGHPLWLLGGGKERIHHSFWEHNGTTHAMWFGTASLPTSSTSGRKTNSGCDMGTLRSGSRNHSQKQMLGQWWMFNLENTNHSKR